MSNDEDSAAVELRSSTAFEDIFRRSLAFYLTVSDAADSKDYNALIQPAGAHARCLLADKGLDAETTLANLAQWKSEAVAPSQSNRRVKIEYNRALYEQRIAQ